MHFLQLSTVVARLHEVHETTSFLLVTLPNIHRFKKNFLTGKFDY